ncbi:hypothetical protein BGZ94_003627 [Podila epigama]|nr:hypothetical protein BGZ94_003627 [Podila epigama]
MMNPGDYTFLFALGMIFAFLDSYGIGANDVSNSFSAAVGSKTLNLKQAVLIASVCEFLGAFLMGSATADTIKGGLIDVKLFEPQPELLMLAMVCSLVGSSTWVLLASSRGWPVSTTHAIVGAITGAGIAGFGGSTVKWGEIGKIISSWLISPLCAGLVTAFIFQITKYFVLRHDNSLRRGLIALPFYFAVTLFINVFYIIFKGSPGLSLSTLPIGTVLGISFGVSAAVYLWCNFFLRTYLRRKLENNEPLRWYHCFYIPFVKPKAPLPPQELVLEEKEASDVNYQGSDDSPLSPSTIKVKNLEEALASSSKSQETMGSVNSGLAALDDTPKPSRAGAIFKSFKSKATKGLNEDINKNSAMDTIHDASTKYDPKTEQLFGTLQILTSCFASFAHGSNDVANAIGPLTTIYYVWKNGAVDVSGKAPTYGGIAIDLGLLTYGYKVMATLGNNITYMSPTRGFSLLLATSLTVLTCSKLGLPVSTTHCITGATTAVGLISGGGRKSVNWRILGQVASSWVVTLPAAGLVSGLLFGLIINSPHKI